MSLSFTKSLTSFVLFSHLKKFPHQLLQVGKGPHKPLSFPLLKIFSKSHVSYSKSLLVSKSQTCGSNSDQEIEICDRKAVFSARESHQGKFYWKVWEQFNMLRSSSPRDIWRSRIVQQSRDDEMRCVETFGWTQSSMSSHWEKPSIEDPLRGRSKIAEEWKDSWVKRFIRRRLSNEFYQMMNLQWALSDEGSPLKTIRRPSDEDYSTNTLSEHFRTNYIGRKASDTNTFEAQRKLDGWPSWGAAVVLKALCFEGTISLRDCFPKDMRL